MPNGKRRKLLKFRTPVTFDEDKEFDADFSKLQNRVKLKRQQFCQEYIKDFNGAAAMRRMGYIGNKTPWIHASEWLKEPYTQWYLHRLMSSVEEKAIVSRNDVLLGLKREAHYFAGLDASSASRISALRTLAKILGMEVTKVEGNLVINGGVMAVPLATSPEEWERNSKEAQKQLKKKVRE